MPSLVGRFAANPKPFSLLNTISYQDPVEAYYPIPKVITASVTVTIQVAFYMNQTLFRRFKTPQMTTQCTVYTGTSLDVSASSWCAPTNEPIKEHVTTKCRLPEVTVRDCGLGLSGTRKLLALEDWPFISNAGETHFSVFLSMLDAEI